VYSCIIPILFLSFSLLLLSIIIISSLLTPPHPQPLFQLSSSNGCEVTPTSVFQNLSIISITSLCVYCSVYLLYSITVILIYPDSYRTFSTCRSTSYLLKAFGNSICWYSQVISIPPHPLLYVMAQPVCFTLGY
jgi:hypothetical protein